MRTQEEVEIKLEELYNKRLKVRFKRCLKLSYLNCKYNQRMVMEKGNFRSTIGTCTNPKKSNNGQILVCNEDEAAEKCCEYCNEMTRESVEEQFKSDISNPKICGQKEPKIAVLLWLLHKEKQFPEMETLEQEGIIRWILRKIGFV